MEQEAFIFVKSDFGRGKLAGGRGCVLRWMKESKTVRSIGSWQIRRRLGRSCWQKLALSRSDSLIPEVTSLEGGDGEVATITGPRYLSI